MRFLGVFISLLSALLFAKEEVLVDIPNAGQIQYEYEEGRLLSVCRLSKSGEILYSHCYQYDESGHLTSETLIGDLGMMQYLTDGKTLTCLSPYSSELVEHDSYGIVRQFIDGRARGNDGTAKVTAREYDERGNLIHKAGASFFYDAKDRLIRVVKSDAEVAFGYNDRSERISKTIATDSTSKTEHSFYVDGSEVAIFSEDGELKQLRVPGLTFNKDVVRPIAIEIGEDVYAPILDRQGNIFKLVHMKTKEVVSYAEIDLWGSNIEELKPVTPWVFSAKHYDSETNLFYFGHRYYDPELKEWISPDPLGDVQSSDLYQYCLGDPLRYIDPDGRFVIAIPIVIWGGAAFTEVLIDAAIIGGVSWLGYEAVKHGNEVMQQAYKPKEGKQKDGTPKTNGPQNDQVKGAVREIERKIGRKLTDLERERLHRHISGQDYGYHDIVEEGIGLFEYYRL